jgi:hypothetical protein
MPETELSFATVCRTRTAAFFLLLFALPSSALSCRRTHRNVFGGGAGYHVIKSARTTFDLFSGVSYARDSFAAYVDPAPPHPTVPATINDNAEALIGEELDSKINARSTLNERFTFYPAISNSTLAKVGDYRLQFDSTVATKLKAWLSWQFTFSDRYISYPPPGLKGNDILLSTGLRVQWGKAKL